MREAQTEGESLGMKLSPHPLRGTAYAATPPVASRHLPTLWGVTLPEGAKERENSVKCSTWNILQGIFCV